MTTEIVALRAELLALQGKYRRLEEALEKIRDMDYRGNRSAGSQIAYLTLKALASCQLEDGEKKEEGI